MLNNSNTAQSPSSPSDPHCTNAPAVRVVPMRRRSRADFWRGEKTAKLLTMRGEGLGNTFIAVQLGISEACVRSKLTELRAAGVPIAKYKSGTRKAKAPPERQYAARVTQNPETKAQASRRATALQHYWHARGYHLARFWVDDSGRTADGSLIYTVRSNLVGGLPPGGRHPSIKVGGR